MFPLKRRNRVSKSVSHHINISSFSHRPSEEGLPTHQRSFEIGPSREQLFGCARSSSSKEESGCHLPNIKKSASICRRFVCRIRRCSAVCTAVPPAQNVRNSYGTVIHDVRNYFCIFGPPPRSVRKLASCMSANLGYFLTSSPYMRTSLWKPPFYNGVF